VTLEREETTKALVEAGKVNICGVEVGIRKAKPSRNACQSQGGKWQRDYGGVWDDQLKGRIRAWAGENSVAR